MRSRKVLIAVLVGGCLVACGVSSFGAVDEMALWQQQQSWQQDYLDSMLSSYQFSTVATNHAWDVPLIPSAPLISAPALPDISFQSQNLRSLAGTARSSAPSIPLAPSISPLSSPTVQGSGVQLPRWDQQRAQPLPVRPAKAEWPFTEPKDVGLYLGGKSVPPLASTISTMGGAWATVGFTAASLISSEARLRNVATGRVPYYELPWPTRHLARATDIISGGYQPMMQTVRVNDLHIRLDPVTRTTLQTVTSLSKTVERYSTAPGLVGQVGFDPFTDSICTTTLQRTWQEEITGPSLSRGVSYNWSTPPVLSPTTQHILNSLSSNNVTLNLPSYNLSNVSTFNTQFQSMPMTTFSMPILSMPTFYTPSIPTAPSIPTLP